MAQFPDMTPTTNGDKMLIQAVNGHKLVFTRGAFGSGSLSDSELFKYVCEAILVNPYIIDVYKVSSSFNKKNITLSIDVKTIYGDMTTSIEV